MGWPDQARTNFKNSDWPGGWPDGLPGACQEPGQAGSSGSEHCNNNNQRRQQLSSNTDKNDRNIPNGNSLQISKHALNYASEYHYAPFKLECHPKLIDKKQGQKLIMNLIKSIKSDFITQNPKFNKIILFDLWWIDSNGDLQIIIKTTELYVYLFKTERYPKELNGIKIIPHHPSHLPPQHTVIIKWVHHSISNDDIKEVLNSKYESIFSIGEMIGSINDKTRHVKIELLSKNEYNSLLNGGKISLFGHLFDVDEFLPAPKVFICGRCNQPGHTKKTCCNSSYDLCRRCGGDRTNSEQHKDCQIKCHHCGGEHVSTDYKCKLIDNYRRQLIDELKKHPERLPPDTHLFIPSEYRSQNDKSKSIYNHEVYEYQQYHRSSQFQSRTYYNPWPEINCTTSTTTSNIMNMSGTIKSLSEELKQVQQRHENEQKRIEQKFKTSLMMMNQAFIIMQQIQQTQQTMIRTMNVAVSQNMFSTCMKLTEHVHSIVMKLKPQVNNNEFDEIIQQINDHGQYLTEAHNEYCQHQDELRNISTKQMQALTQAFNVAFKNDDN
ncbi:unnamed protein product [Rotaria sp. Silwood1]|nr:unnamed protein product [Rotaria sp. Silwood1]